MRRAIAITKTIEHVTCDFCDRDLTMFVQQCLGCGKDVCRACAITFSAHPVTTMPFDGNELTRVLCFRCAPLTGDFAREARKLQDNLAVELAKILDEWQKVCKGESA
jgi:hypothetical protein